MFNYTTLTDLSQVFMNKNRSKKSKRIEHSIILSTRIMSSEKNR
jgi:hypothetical protein